MRAFFSQATIHSIDLVVPEQFSNELKKKKSHVHRQFRDEPSCVHGCSAMNLLPHVYMAMCAHGYWMFSDELLATRVHGNVYTWVHVQR